MLWPRAAKEDKIRKSIEFFVANVVKKNKEFSSWKFEKKMRHFKLREIMAP